MCNCLHIFTVYLFMCHSHIFQLDPIFACEILVPGYWPFSVWLGHGGLKSFSPGAFRQSNCSCCRTWFTCFPLLSSTVSIKYRIKWINQDRIIYTQLAQLLVLDFDNFHTLINRTRRNAGSTKAGIPSILQADGAEELNDITPAK